MGFLRFDGPARGYWDTYITAPAMFMSGQAVDFYRIDGTPVDPIQLRGQLPQDLVDKDTFGIITKDQRIGGGMVAAPAFSAFGQIGFRILFALSFALIIPLTVLVWRRIQPGSDWAGLCGGLLLAWNPFVVTVDRLNNNLFALPIMLAVLALILDRERRKSTLLLAGILFGILAGIRNEAICFVPAIVYWYVRSDGVHTWKQRFGQLLTVGGLTVVVLSPFLYWKWYAFGHPLMHPSQYPHFQGFRPEFYHELFGSGFCFNGLFNWPLNDTLVRTPHFGYPTYILFPLVTARAFGVIGVALTILGFGLLWRSHGHVSRFLLFWMLPVYVLFGPQENWEEVKMTFMLLAYPPLGVAFAAGVYGCFQRGQLRRRLVALAVIALAVFAGIRWVGTVEAPVDERWYQRFPNAAPENPSSLAGLDPADRNDHIYFERHESSEEIAQERAKLTAGYPWPMPYLPSRFHWDRSKDLIEGEWGQRSLRIEEIWDHIYRQLPTNQVRDERCPARETGTTASENSHG